MAEHLHKVDHGYIRYANCWEDADILVEALDVHEGHRVLSIGSAGDNSFSLLLNAPQLVLAVDINPVQLHLIELKKAAITALDRDACAAFLGFSASNERLVTFERLRSILPTESQGFWASRSTRIEAGIITQGKFERYFSLFRKWLLPLVHGKKRRLTLIAPKSEAEQENFYLHEWDSWRWRALFRLFFSRTVMGRLGRDPAFLRQVKLNVGDFILGRASDHLRSTACQQNEFLEFIWTGTFECNLPHYMRDGNYERIRKNIDRLRTFEGLAEAAFREYGSFDRFNLSNIFEYMPTDVFTTVARDLVDHANADARLAYWNLMVQRQLSSVEERLVHEEALSAQLTKRDKGFFYRGFLLDRVKQ
jgi:S-adenosylmethionine-diacylglycerol 3-amino-3-carboxypropyl transferase